MCFLIFKRDFFFLREIQIHSRNMRTKLGIQNCVDLSLFLSVKLRYSREYRVYNRVNYIYFFFFFIFACIFVLFLFSS